MTNFSRADYEETIGYHARLSLNIPDGEPLFLLRAQDKAAAPVLRVYALLIEIFGAEPEMVRSAQELAAAMEAWQPKKVPDL